MKPEDIVRLDVTEHAVERFMERGGPKTRDRALTDLFVMAAEGKEVWPPAGWVLENEIDTRHGADNMYIRSGGWLLVVRDCPEGLLVVTALIPEPSIWWW